MPLRIAHISPIMPALGGNGLAMRTSMFTQAAEETGQTLVIAIEPKRTPATDAYEFHPSTKVASICEGQDTRLSLISQALPKTSRPALLRAYGRPLTSVSLSAATITQIVERLRAFKPDQIILSRSQLLPILDAFDDALAEVPLLVDLDDDDAALCREFSAFEHDAGRSEKALWHEAQANVYDSLISHHAGKIDEFTIASNTASTALQKRLGLPNIITIPNAAPSHDVPTFGSDDATAKKKTGTQTLVFVGNLSYAPNVDGVSWFVEEVFPLLRRRLENLKLVIAGSNPSDDLAGICRSDGVELVISPEIVAPIYRLADAAIVPLRFGSGSRIKILEAGTYGLPVISTFTGADGLDLQGQTQAFLSSETPDALSAACLECLMNPGEAVARSKALQGFIERNHTRSVIVSRLHKILASRPQSDPR